MNSHCLTHAPGNLAQEGCEFIKFEACSKMALLFRKCIPELALRGRLGYRNVFVRSQANLEMTLLFGTFIQQLALRARSGCQGSFGCVAVSSNMY